MHAVVERRITGVARLLVVNLIVVLELERQVSDIGNLPDAVCGEPRLELGTVELDSSADAIRRTDGK
jgi:hypothetical protein